ncbi:MAG: DNA topoisomerase I, partial [Prevotella sp.]|nr:DNA topoisomerase I [Prevotella sp.]
DAIEHPRHIDMNLVNAQQARRVLDRLVGFKLSPVLWRKVKPALSAGRVQSVAVRLIVEREREIQDFKSEPYYHVTGKFLLADGKQQEITASLSTRFKTHEEALAFLEECREAEFVVGSVTKKPLKRTPAPPFTTSTLQQEAARKLGFTVSQTMMVAQRLYESGHITYMRTDSVNLSSLCINTSKEEITNLYGAEYSRPRKFQTHSKGAQEAHEAIRPTYMSKATIDSTAQERRLYELIWKRTAASQMADAEIEKTTVEIQVKTANGESTPNTQNSTPYTFVANGEVVKFDGFLKVYRESTDDEADGGDAAFQLPVLKKNDLLTRQEITASERFSQGPVRYNEASLVHKLEELGIGRPSTYAPTISTIQQREYTQKGDKKGYERQFTVDTLKGQKITTKTKKEMAGSEKGRLLPTDIGIVVNDFLIKHFPDIMDYGFTARVEQDFDKIAEGKTDWNQMMTKFYKQFEPTVEKVIKARSEHKAGERQLGIDPKSGKPVFVKIGRFGPVVQIGAADDKEKPRFAQLPTNKTMETVTLEDALSQFQLPRTVGQFEDNDVVIGVGRFGPYIMHDKKFVSLPKGVDPMAITLDESVALIQEKRQQEEKRHLKTFAEDAKLEILNGRYGPYIAYDGKNYRLPKNLHARAAELSYEEAMKIVKKS